MSKKIFTQMTLFILDKNKDSFNIALDFILSLFYFKIDKKR